MKVSSQKLRAGLAVCALLSFPILSAYGDDLTLPPEMRGVTPPPAVQPEKPAPAPAKKAHAQKAKKASKDKDKAPADAPSASADAHAKPSQNGDDNPLSLGMKWNSDGASTSASPSNLFNDYNRNVQGQSTGTGGEVGVKYKF